MRTIARLAICAAMAAGLFATSGCSNHGTVMRTRRNSASEVMREQHNPAEDATMGSRYPSPY